MVTSTFGGANVGYAAAANEPVPALDPERGVRRYWGEIGVSDGEIVGTTGEP